jgi:methylase of polypeptide subunit release factors
MVGRFEAEQVLGSASAMAVLGRMADELRAIGYANEVLVGAGPRTEALTRLALGLDVDRVALGSVDVERLAAAGALDLRDGTVVPRFAVFARDATLVLLPRDDGFAPHRVYFGRDSVWLAEIAGQVRSGGGAAADLGTGAGAVAALLAHRYARFVATDVAPRTAASAAITMALNPRADGRPAGAVCLADVACGLRPGSFDLVTANPPWVPDRRDGSASRTYSAGGSSGFELPRRFMVEAAELLAPGGVAVVLGIDATWDDGSRPLPALVRGLRRLGYEVAVQPTEQAVMWPTFESDMTTWFPRMATVAHVAVLIRRDGDTATRRPT